MKAKHESIKDQIPNGLLTLIVAAILLASIAPIASAGWDCRKPVTINNPGDTLSDYQVLITLNSSNFDYSKANLDGSDIGFVDEDNTVALNYWIEEWNAAGDSMIWVKVPSIKDSENTTIYMYYGNPIAISQSNGTATFELFDDFGDNILDPMWTVNQLTTYSESKGRWQVDDPNDHTYYNYKTGIYTTFDLPNSFHIKVETLEWIAQASDLGTDGISLLDSSDELIAGIFMSDGMSKTSGQKSAIWAVNAYASGVGTLPASGSAKIEIYCDQSNNYNLKWNGATILNGTEAISVDTVVLTTTQYQTYNAKKARFSDIIVCKYASPGPIHSVGSEESDPPKPSIPTFIRDTDTDADGVPDVWDVDNSTPTEYWTDSQGIGRMWGDMNGDGKLTSVDALMILQAAAEAISL